MIIQRVIILELKMAKSFKEIEAGCDNALEQIKNRIMQHIGEMKVALILQDMAYAFIINNV